MATDLHTHVYVRTVLHMYPALYPDSSLRLPFAGTGHKKPLADYVAWLPTATCPNGNILLPGTLISIELPQPSFVRTKFRLPQSMDVRLIVGRGDLAAPTS